MGPSIWKNRNFIFFVFGQSISQLGTAVSTFVIPWVFLEVTGSAVKTGISFAIGFIPYILLSLPAGVWADSLNRKALMMVSDFARLCLLLSIPIEHSVLGHVSLSVLYSVQGGVSAFSAIFDAAYEACLPSIVSSEQLAEANGWFQTSTSLSRLLGPVCGGIAVGFLGAADSILIDSFSYLPSMISLVAITRQFSAMGPRVHQAFRRNLLEGVSVIWGIKPIRYLMLFATLINFVGPGMDVALLYRVQHELGLGAAWAGTIMTCLSGGMLLGSLLHVRIQKRVSTGLLLTSSMVLQVIPPILLAIVTNSIEICLIQTSIGVLLAAWNIQSVTLRQTLIPDALRGRCATAFRLSAWISIPLGDTLAGILSQHGGTEVYFFWSACILLIAALISLISKLPRALSPAQTELHSTETEGIL